MLSFEQEMRGAITKNSIPFTDNSNTPDKLDFKLRIDEHTFQLEVKEKRQRTKLSNWPDFGVPEDQVFILDDLSARKLIRYAPFSGIAVRNNVTGKYYFIDVVTLFLMPRIRVNRVLNETGVMKGKWMLDLRNWKQCNNTTGILWSVKRYLKDMHSIFSKTDCYGSFVGEQIAVGGELRTADQKNYDYAVTR